MPGVRVVLATLVLLLGLGAVGVAVLGDGETEPTTSAPATGTTARGPFELMVQKLGMGAERGVVTSDPAGIDCGLTCSAVFDADAEVRLVAEPSARFEVTRWSDPSCGAENVCSVIVDDNRGVTVTFDPR